MLLVAATGLVRCMRATAPLAWVYTLYSLVRLLRWRLAGHPWRRGGRGWALLRLWALSECAFHLFCRWVEARFQSPVLSPRCAAAFRAQTFQRTMDVVSPGAGGVARWVSAWFRGAPVELVREENAQELLAYGLWHLPPEALGAHDAEELGGYLRRLANQVHNGVSQRFPPGHNDQISCYRPGLEPLDIQHHPLAFYVATHSLGALAGLRLWAAGYRRHSAHHLRYWLRPGSRCGLPYVFVHGVGVGILPYCPFLARLAATGRPVLVVEVPHISMRVCLEVPSIALTLRALRAMLANHGFRAAHWVSHSYGSFYVSWLLRSSPQAVAYATWIDAACFLLCFPKLLLQFLYEKPTRPDRVARLFTYLVRRELFLSNAIARHFWWYHNICWKEQLSCPSLVVLSGRDEVLPVERISDYLSSHVEAPLSQLVLRGLIHGQFLVSPEAQERIIQAMFEMEARR